VLPSPGITRALLATNTILYLAMLAFDAFAGRAGGPRLPFDVMAPSVETLQAFGMLSTERLFECGRVWLLVTPIFLHLGLLHFLFNTFALWQLGPLAEQAFGRTRFLVLYLGTGIAGNVAGASFGIGGAGASGAIFGLMGATLVFARRRRHAIGPGLVYQWLLRWLLYGVLLSLFVRNINHFAHGGGFVTGLALGVLADRAGAAAIWSFGARVAVAASAVSFVFVAIDAPKLLRGGAVLTLDHELKGVWSAVDRFGDPSEPDAQSASEIRDAVWRLRDLRGLRGEVEAYRRRAVELLETLRASSEPLERRDAAASFVEIVRGLNDWLGENACAHGLSFR